MYFSKVIPHCGRGKPPSFSPASPFFGHFLDMQAGSHYFTLLLEFGAGYVTVEYISIHRKENNVRLKILKL